VPPKRRFRAVFDPADLPSADLRSTLRLNHHMVQKPG
jgi:hypothetical protein